MKYIPLTQGYRAIVNNRDYAKVAGFKWYANVKKNTVYACRRRRQFEEGTFQADVKLHRFIMGVTDDLQVDHINGNGLDNRRANLRICTVQQNGFNSKLKGNKTGFKGVSYLPNIRGSKHYRAQIMLNRKYIYLGYYRTPYEAAKAYNQKAREIFGDFANLNPL